MQSSSKLVKLQSHNLELYYNLLCLNITFQDIKLNYRTKKKKKKKKMIFLTINFGNTSELKVTSATKQ